jgi:hypothetical protein
MCPVVPDAVSLLGGLRAAMRPTVPCRMRASSIKKSLADLAVQLGPHVPNACAHISKAPDVRAIMGLQDVWVGSTVNTCKACGHAATVHHQHCGPLA